MSGAETRRGAWRDDLRGRSLWTRLALGCGALLLVAVGCVGGIGYALYWKGARVLDRSWKELRFTTERLRTVESTRALYRGNPRLSEIYPTEKEFMKKAEGWRPKLGRVPDEPPPLLSVLRDRQLLEVHENRSDGHETVRMKYVFPNGAVLELESDQGRLTNLLME